MPTALIVGSGPEAAGAALALCQEPDQRVTIIDVGGRLDANHQAVVDAMAATPPAEWSPHSWTPEDLNEISVQPIPNAPGGLPEKRAFGSDFPFRDCGQLMGVRSVGLVNDRVVSGAKAAIELPAGTASRAGVVPGT